MQDTLINIAKYVAVGAGAILTDRVVFKRIGAWWRNRS